MKYKITLTNGSELIVYINEDKLPEKLVNNEVLEFYIQNLFAKEQIGRTIYITNIEEESKGKYKILFWDGRETLSGHIITEQDLARVNLESLPKIEVLKEENKNWIIKYKKEISMGLIYSIAAKNAAKDENIIITDDLLSFFNIGNRNSPNKLKPDILKPSQKKQVLKDLYEQIEHLSLEEFQEEFNQFLSNLSDDKKKNQYIKKKEVESVIKHKLQFTPETLSIELQSELATNKQQCLIKAKEHIADFIYTAILNYLDKNNNILNKFINTFVNENTIEKCNKVFLPFLPTNKIKTLFPNGNLIELEKFKRIFRNEKLGLTYEKINEALEGKELPLNALLSAYAAKQIYQKYFSLDITRHIKFEFSDHFRDLQPTIEKNKELQSVNVFDPNKNRTITFYFTVGLAEKLEKLANKLKEPGKKENYFQCCYNLLTEEVLNKKTQFEFLIQAHHINKPIIVYQEQYGNNSLAIIVAGKNLTPFENCQVRNINESKIKTSKPNWIETKSYSLTHGSLEEALTFANLLNSEIVKHLDPEEQLNYLKLKITSSITMAIEKYSKTSNFVKDRDKFNIHVNGEDFYFVDVGLNKFNNVDFRKYSLNQIKAILDKLTTSIQSSHFEAYLEEAFSIHKCPILLEKGNFQFTIKPKLLELFITEELSPANTPRSSQTNTPPSSEESFGLEKCKGENDTIAAESRKHSPKVNNKRFDQIQLSEIEEIKLGIMNAIIETYKNIENNDKKEERSVFAIFDKVLPAIDHEENQFRFLKLSLPTILVKVNELNSGLKKKVAEKLRSNLSALKRPVTTAKANMTVSILQVNTHSISLNPQNNVLLNDTPSENNVDISPDEEKIINDLFNCKYKLIDELNSIIDKFNKILKDFDDEQQSLLKIYIENEKHFYPMNNRDLFIFKQQTFQQDCYHRLSKIKKLLKKSDKTINPDPVKIYLKLLSEKNALQNELNGVDKLRSLPSITDGLYEFLSDANSEEAIQKLKKEISELKDNKNKATLLKVEKLVNAINNNPKDNLLYILIKKEKENPNLFSYFKDQVKNINNNLSYDNYLTNEKLYDSLLELSQQITTQEQYEKIRRLFSEKNELLEKLGVIKDKIEKLNNKNNHTFSLLEKLTQGDNADPGQTTKDLILSKENYIKLNIDEKLTELDKLVEHATNYHQLFISNELLDRKIEIYENELNKLDFKQYETIAQQLEGFLEKELPDTSKKILNEVKINLTQIPFKPGNEVELETLGYSLRDDEVKFVNDQKEILNKLKSEFEYNDITFNSQLENYQTSIQLRNPKTNPIKGYEFVTKAKENCETIQKKYNEELDKLNTFIEAINEQKIIEYCNNKINEIEEALSQIEKLSQLLQKNRNVKIPGFLNAEFLKLSDGVEKLVKSELLLISFKTELTQNQDKIKQKNIFDTILSNNAKTNDLLLILSEKGLENYLERLNSCYSNNFEAEEIFKNAKNLLNGLPNEIIEDNLNQLEDLENQFYNPQNQINLEELKTNVTNYKNDLLNNLYIKIGSEIGRQKQLLEDNPLSIDCNQSTNKNLRQIAIDREKLIADNQRDTLDLQNLKSDLNNIDDKITNAKLLLSKLAIIGNKHLNDVKSVNLIFDNIGNKKIAEIETAINQLDSLSVLLSKFKEELLALSTEDQTKLNNLYKYEQFINDAQTLIDSKSCYESFKNALTQYKKKIEETDISLNPSSDDLRAILETFQDVNEKLKILAINKEECDKTILAKEIDEYDKEIRSYLNTVTRMKKDDKKLAILYEDSRFSSRSSSGNLLFAPHPSTAARRASTSPTRGEVKNAADVPSVAEPEPSFWSHVSEFFTPVIDHFEKYGGYYLGGLSIIGGSLFIAAGVLTLAAGGLGTALILGGVAACGAGEYMIMENGTKYTKKVPEVEGKVRTNNAAIHGELGCTPNLQRKNEQKPLNESSSSLGRKPQPTVISVVNDLDPFVDERPCSSPPSPKLGYYNE